MRGNIFFRMGSVSGASNVLSDAYRTKALTPTLKSAGPAPGPPGVTPTQANTLKLVSSGSTPLRSWVVYEYSAAGLRVHDLYPAQTAEIPVPAEKGSYYITAVARDGRESLAIELKVQ